MRWRSTSTAPSRNMAGARASAASSRAARCINLPTHTFPTDDGGVDLKCPTEIAISDRREAELAKSGLIPLIHRKNTDKAAFIGAQSLYKPKKYFGPGRRRGDGVRQPVGAPALHVRGVALRALPEVHGARQDRLHQGEGRSCDAGCRSGSPNTSMAIRSTPARRRRRASRSPDARVDVFENEENPGYYSAKFYLRPHFQLEGMDIGLSLGLAPAGAQDSELASRIRARAPATIVQPCARSAPVRAAIDWSVHLQRDREHAECPRHHSTMETRHG